MAIADALGLSAEEIVALAKNSFAASFLPDAEKQRRIDAGERAAGDFARNSR